MSTQKRQLSVIMFTDLVGFTLLMGNDERKAMSAHRTNREVHKKIIRKHTGKWLKEMGDGTLARFYTVSDAVYCAGDLINACNKQNIDIRIGIDLGDVIEENGDIFGDGVNVASRLQSLAGPNQIMVSAPIHRDVKNKSGITSTFIEEKQLKNVDQPVRISLVEVTGSHHDAQNTYKTISISRNSSIGKHILVGIFVATVIILGDSYFLNPVREGESTSDIADTADVRKTIAVLPFKDLSAEQDQEYLGDGIAEEIINRLASVKNLRVIGRTSSFSFKGKDTDLKTIGKLLEAETILEGSVQKSGGQLRVTVQLINAKDASHIWSERFDRVFSDVFSIQDELANLVISKITYVQPPEGRLFDNNPGINPEAYEYFLRGKFISESIFQLTFDNKDFWLAEDMFRNAIKLDPDFALPHAGLADIYNSYQKVYAYQDNNPKKKEYIDIQLKEIEIAAGLDPGNDYIRRVMGWIYWGIEEYDMAYESFKNSVQLNPNDSWNLLSLAYFLIDNGLYEEGLLAINRSIEFDPIFTAAYNVRGVIYMHMGKYDLSQKDFQRTIEIDSDNLNSFYWSGVLYKLTNDTQNYEKAIERINKINPEVSSTLSITTNIFLSSKGKQAFDEYYIISALLERKYQHAIELIEENEQLLFNYQMLNKMPLFNPLRDEKIFIEFVESKKSEYITSKAKYGKLDFLCL